MACPDQFEEVVVDVNEELQTILQHGIWSFPHEMLYTSVLHVVLVVLLLYLHICDKKINKLSYTVMKNTVSFARYH